MVYVSPLKALGNDVQKNLRQPLDELGALAAASGAALPDLRVMVRSGDTPAHERQAMTRRPPHVLITTPESLYILLTAERSRRFLADAETVIVDEIHAVAQDKRGAHLALSLERLDALAGRPLQRIGLSATQRPVEEVGRLLVGAARPLPTIIDVGHRRTLDLSVWVPDIPLGPIATHEQWAELTDRIATLTATHRTTIVFVHTRRLVERVAHALEERVGAGRVVAHHGSMARRTRLEAEERLKSGAVPVAVATASLELGIDVGTVDLVCHVGSPRALATLIQRVGRSGHARGATPKGILFPLTRDDLVQASAAVRAVRAGELDALRIPTGPRDVLAQQCVAIAAGAEIGTEALFALVRRAYPYRDLPRAEFDAVLELLAEGVATRRGRRSAHLHWDRVNGRLRARRGARLVAITSGGAIPDTADYQVIEEPRGLLVGTVNEDFAVENARRHLPARQPLGASGASRRAAAGRGRAGRAQRPVLGRRVARTDARAVGGASRLREGWRGASVAWLAGGGVAAGCRPAGGRLPRRAHAALGGVMPTIARWSRALLRRGRRDAARGTPLRRSHQPRLGWRCARFCVSFNFELQAAATDDGIVLSLGAAQLPLDSVFSMVRRATWPTTWPRPRWRRRCSPTAGAGTRVAPSPSCATSRDRRCPCRCSGCAPRICWRRSSRSSSAAPRTWERVRSPFPTTRW